MIQIKIKLMPTVNQIRRRKKVVLFFKIVYLVQFSELNINNNIYIYYLLCYNIKLLLNCDL